MDDETVAPDPSDAALIELWQRGRAAWPALSLEVSSLDAYLRERAPQDADFGAWLRGLGAAVVFLACACAHDVPGAVRALEAAYLTKMDAYLRALRPTPELVAETKQELLKKLFVGSEGRPAKIRQYGGRGSLEGWVRLVALGTAVDLLSSETAHQKRDQELDEIADAVAPGGDPEIELMKASYRDEFVAAFREAMSSLSPRDRNLLRFIFVDRLTPARVAVIHGVHRTTVMRWIEAAQRDVMARTRTRLMERLRLSPAECDDIFALVKSRLHVTLTSLLRTAS